MKRITPLLLAMFLFGTFATSGCIIRTRDRHHHHHAKKRHDPPPPKRDHRDHRDNRRGGKDNRCRWERC